MLESEPKTVAALDQIIRMLSANSATIAVQEGTLNGNRLVLAENRESLIANTEALQANNALLRENNAMLAAICRKLGVDS